MLFYIIYQFVLLMPIFGEHLVEAMAATLNYITGPFAYSYFLVLHLMI